ncbi:MAG: sensor histidine kinase, partial [Candidatus Thorarchaeota archaeon]
LLKNCIYELSYLAKSRKIILKSNIPEKIYVEIDNSRFSQVIFNIITNAIKNTPPKGLVFIRLTEYQNHVDIIVKDTGIGITKEEKERLFQKFGKIERYGKGYNLDIEGVGLGLFISKGILDLHGGEILVESEGRNRGSTFIIRLFKKNITR